MSNSKGTPSTLKEAILHAKEQINELCDDQRLVSAEIVIIETFVRDFLAQKFGAAILNAAETPAEKEISELWKSISAA